MDADGFAALYREHYGEVYRYLLRRCGYAHHLAEDLASETFCRALRHRESWQDQGKSPAAWLVTIARNLLFDHHKIAHRRHESLTAEFFAAEAPVHAASDPLPETVLEQHELRSDLDRLLAALSDPQRRCLQLRFYAGQSIAETADILGVSHGAARSLQHRALTGVRSRLTGARP